MEYAEFAELSLEERSKVIRSLPEDEVNYLWDQRPFIMGEFEPSEGLEYFDNIDDLHAYVLEHHTPLAKPWKANETAGHEFAHAECALAVGATGVKYAVSKKKHPITLNRVFTYPHGPVSLPNLARAAIAAHPYSSFRSLTDMQYIRDYGYASREQVAERITQWNERNNGLLIPMPQHQQTYYPELS